MSWFNIDDKAHSDDRFNRAELDGCGLFAVAGSYCMDHLTDGFVPRWFVKQRPGGLRAAKKLVAVGLWAVVEDGYQFVEWKEALTREYVEAKKEKWREDKRQWREAQRTKATPMSTADSEVESEVESRTTNTNTNTNTNGSGHVLEAHSVRESGTALGEPASDRCTDCARKPRQPGLEVCDDCAARRAAVVGNARRGRTR